MKQYEITVNDKVYRVSVRELENEPLNGEVSQKTTGIKNNAPLPSSVKTASDTQITAPMPGTILRVSVTEDQVVQKGTVLCILEAMKMENEIVAPTEGRVSAIQIKPNQAVVSGELLLVIS